MKKADWKYLVDSFLFICLLSLASIGFLMGFVLAEGPTGQETEKFFLGLHRHQWGNIHLYLSITFTILVVVHLVLNWNWIKQKARNLFKKRWGTMLIITVAASFMVLFLSWVFSQKNSPAYKGYGMREGISWKRQNETKKDFPEKKPTVERSSIPLPPSVKKEEISKKQEVKGEEKQHHIDEPKLTKGRLDVNISGILITGQMTFYDIESKTGIPARKIADKLGLPTNIPLNENLGRLRKIYRFKMQEVRDVISSILEKDE